MPRKIHVLSYDGPSISMWLIALKATVLHADSLGGGMCCCPNSSEKDIIYVSICE